MSRAESLRLLADYTATEIDANAATKLVEQAENYVRTVERVFDLQQSAEVETGPVEVRDNHSRDEQRAEAGDFRDVDEMEEARRKGREEWLKLQKQKLESGAPTLEERRAKGREDWLNLQRQKNQPIKERGKGSPAANRERGDRANDSAKGNEDDLDP